MGMYEIRVHLTWMEGGRAHNAHFPLGASEDEIRDGWLFPREPDLRTYDVFEVLPPDDGAPRYAWMADFQTLEEAEEAKRELEDD